MEQEKQEQKKHSLVGWMIVIIALIFSLYISFNYVFPWYDSVFQSFK